MRVLALKLHRSAVGCLEVCECEHRRVLVILFLLCQLNFPSGAAEPNVMGFRAYSPLGTCSNGNRSNTRYAAPEIHALNLFKGFLFSDLPFIRRENLPLSS